MKMAEMARGKKSAEKCPSRRAMKRQQAVLINKASIYCSPSGWFFFFIITSEPTGLQTGFIVNNCTRNDFPPLLCALGRGGEGV